MTDTDNLGLGKPDSADNVDISVFNTNADLIDAAIADIVVTPVDLTGYVQTTDLAGLLPQKITSSADYVENGITPARGDTLMLESATGPWFRVPAAIADDVDARAALIAGAGGSLRLNMVTTGYAVGKSGDAYTTTITASGGATFAGGEYIWTKVSGTLPGGVTLSPTSGTKAVSATISGTLSGGAVTPSIIMRATDALGQSVTLTATMTITASGTTALAFTIPSLPPAQVGSDYSFSLLPFVSGGVTTPTYTFSSTTLPTGRILLDTDGSVTGTRGMLYSQTVARGGVLRPPDVAGPISVQVSVTDGTTTVNGGTVTLQINSAAVGPSLDLADLVSTSSVGVNHIWWFGDSTVQGEAGNFHLKGGGQGNAVEILRVLYANSSGIPSLGAGFFGMWRTEWSKGSGFVAGLQAATTDVTPWAESTGNVKGGVWADPTGGVLAANTLTFTRHATNTITHVDIEYVDVATLSTGGSYSLDGGTTWIDLPAFTTPAIALHSTVRVATTDPTNIKIRSANAAGTAKPLAVVGITCYSANPATNAGFIIHNMGNAGAHITDLVHTSGGKPWLKVWNTGAAAVILGPNTNESQETSGAADSLFTLGQTAINALRSRTLTGATSSGTGNRTITFTGLATKDQFVASSDVGKVVTHANIPEGTKIESVTSGSIIVLDADITAITAQSVAVVCPVTPTIIPVSQYFQLIRKFYPGGLTASGSLPISASTSAISGAPAGTFDVSTPISQDANVVVTLNTTVTGGALTVAASTRLTPTSDTAATTVSNTSPSFTGTSGTFTLKSSYRTANSMTALRTMVASLCTTNTLTGCDLASSTDAPYFFSSGALNKTNGLLYDQLHLTQFGHAAMASALHSKITALNLVFATADIYSTGARAGQAVDPAFNVQQINNRAASMAALTPQGRLFCSVGTVASKATISIGVAANATTFPTLIIGGNLNNWDLGNVWFKLAPNQPSNDPMLKKGPGRLMSLANATAPQLNLCFDGNGINQYTTTAVNPNYGTYFHGMSLTGCGAISGNITVKNVRGIDSSSSPTTDPGSLTWHQETFHFQSGGGYGADDVVMTVLNDDGATRDNTASGAAWQYSAAPDLVKQITLTASDIRHGLGHFSGGTSIIREGSSATNCDRGFNIEAGFGLNSPRETTKLIVFGSATGATNGQILTTGCIYGIALINNNSGTVSVPSTQQIGTVVTYGHTSTNDCRGVIMTQTGVTNGLFMVNYKCITPTLQTRAGVLPVETAASALKYATSNGTAVHTAMSSNTHLTTCSVSTGFTAVSPGYGSTDRGTPASFTTF